MCLGRNQGGLDPDVFVNGEMLKGAMAVEELEQKINRC
jgi:hypothetical protein